MILFNRTPKRPPDPLRITAGMLAGVRPDVPMVSIAGLSRQPGLLANVAHPPTRTYASAEEAADQGLCVVMPAPA